MKTLKIAIGVLILAALAVSCIPEQQSIGGAGTTLVKYTPGDEFNLLAMDALSTSQTFTLFMVRRDVPNSTALNQTTTVEFKLDTDTAIIKKYNADNDTEFGLMPGTMYSTNPATTGGKVTFTFAPGEFAKEFKITIPNAAGFDFSKQYMLAYKITVTGEGTFSQAVNDTIYRQIMAKNDFDGIYEVSAVTPMVDAANAGLVGNYPFRYSLITTGALSNDCFDTDEDYPLHSILNGGSWSYYGSFAPQVQFNAAGEIVAMTNYWGNPAGNTRGCMLDVSQTWGRVAGTKNIRVKYYMTQTNVGLPAPYIRTTFDELWTYKSKR